MPSPHPKLFVATALVLVESENLSSQKTNYLLVSKL